MKKQKILHCQNSSKI